MNLFNKQWQSMTVTEVFSFFLCDSNTGLTSTEVSLRLKKFGNNKNSYFSSLVWDILTTKVIREGKTGKVKNSALALGDLVILEKNKIVPADIRLVNVDNLSVNQFVLSGSEEIIYKNNNTFFAEPSSIYNLKNMVFAGSAIVYGWATGIVVATGQETQIAKTNKQSIKNTRKLKKLKKLLASKEIILNERVETLTLTSVDTVIINFSAPLDAIKEYIRIFSHQMGKNLIICTDEITARRLRSITPGMTHINKKYFKEKSNKALMEADYPLMCFTDVDSADILRFYKVLGIKNRKAICLDTGKNSILATMSIPTVVATDTAVDEAIVRSNYLVNSFRDPKKNIEQVKLLIT